MLGNRQGTAWYGMTRLAVVALGFVALMASAAVTYAAKMHSITIDIDQVRTIDKYDELSRGDLFARVTIAGETKTTEVLKQIAATEAIVKTKWVITKDVKPGTHPIKIELVDKDLTQDDVIDINRVDKRRVLEFTVNTDTCKVEGFSTVYKCKSRISRTGKENKAAEIFFTVSVKK